MGLFSRFFGEGKKQYEDEQRANQFISMFARVSTELGLSGTNLTREFVLFILHNMGVLDNSADVFIQIVLVIHSHPEGKGLTLLKQLGRGVVKKISLENTLNNMEMREISSVYKLIHGIIPDLREMFEDVDENLIKEPLLLLLAFLNHVGRKRESILMDTPANLGDTRSLMSYFKRGGMVPVLDIYKSDYNQIGKTKVAIRRGV